jgi:hypothetical protein
MIRILREVTGTVDAFTYQPHLYYVNEKDRLVWFQVGDYSRGLDKYSKPLAFDTRGRKFDLVGTVPELHDDESIVEIKSDSGYIHHVNKIKKSCTCKGYKFRGKCKHLNMVFNKAA